MSYPTMLPDPTFYPSPRLAASGPAEKLAYVVTISPGDVRADALVVVDVDPQSTSYAKVVGRVDMPNRGDELHHFGWNACSSALCPANPHPHIERRYLVVPGLRSSRMYILDTKPDPRKPKLTKVIEPAEIAKKAGYTRPHTVHCGPEGIYVSALGSPEGKGPGGVFLLDHNTFDVIGPWEKDRGPQYLAYDAWWHLTQDTMVTSEWGTPDMVENGLVPELLLGKKYGRHVHFWDLRKARHIQALPVGDDDQIVLELRPAHDPTKSYGFVGVVVSVKDLSSSIWLWHKKGGKWALEKVIEIPAEPADPSLLPPALQPFKAVPPLVSDIDLSVDDRFLYVSCWGTGEMRQYDVSDPFHPKQTGSVHLGGIVRHTPHPRSGPLNGGPQMVEVSRDGRRVYFTNSLYSPWDAQFYPEGIRGWMAKLDVGANGGITPDPKFFLEFEGERPHQVRLQGGDASSDSYCFA
ncbi:MAG TPA: selenium-binding family protein [Gemmatimonadales bacterium]|nr:selenium-binding family protein [Gemmatimonadales bacterium]